MIPALGASAELVGFATESARTGDLLSPHEAWLSRQSIDHFVHQSAGPPASSVLRKMGTVTTGFRIFWWWFGSGGRWSGQIAPKSLLVAGAFSCSHIIVDLDKIIR